MPDTMTTVSNPSIFGKFIDFFDGFSNQNDGTVSSTDERPEVTSTSEENSENSEFLKNGLAGSEHQSENGMVGDSKRSPTLSPTSSNSSDKILKFDGFHLFLSDDEDLKKGMNYKDYDVVGPSHDNPYPWTNVKSVQCDLKLASSDSALQTEIDEPLCSQCNKKLSGGDKGSALKKLFSSSRKENPPSRTHSLADQKDMSSKSRRHDRARSQPVLGNAYSEEDIPENDERGVSPEWKMNGLPHYNHSDDIVPSPVIHRRIDKRPTVILTSHHVDEDVDRSSLRSLSIDASQESLVSGVSVSSLDVPLPNLRIKAPLPEKSNNSDSDGDIENESKVETRRPRERRSAIAPCLPNEEMLIEPDSMANGNNDGVGDGRRSLRGSHSGSSGSVLEGYMNQRFEDSLTELNRKVMLQEAQMRVNRPRRTRTRRRTKTELEEALKKYTIYDHEELEFTKYADEMDWMVFMKDVLKTEHITKPSHTESKRRNKIWELFRSEVVFLVNHILILKNEFQDPLLFLISNENTFENIEPRKIFANLDEICTVSTAFCRELYRGLRDTTTREIFAPTDVIVRLLENFDMKICPAYQTYCMNYDSGALQYLKINSEQEDFRTFLEIRERACSSRLGIKDYLAAPIQRITKYPLLLKEIRGNTEDHNAKNHLAAVITKVAEAINNLEKKVKWLAKFERLKELDEMLIWPPTDPVEGKNAVTDYLRSVLAENTQLPNQMLFGSNRRNLASEGPLQMLENNTFLDVYILVFEDLLLLTRIKKKKQSTAGLKIAMRQSIIPKSSDCTLSVYKQPIPLDRISIIDMDQEQGVDLGTNIFALVQFSRYGQPTSVTVLAATTEQIKNKWIQIIETTRDKSIQINKESPGRKSSKKKHHGEQHHNHVGSDHTR